MLVDDVWFYGLWKESADLDLNLQINYKWEEAPAFESVPLPALKDIVLGTEYTLASFGNGLLTTGQYVQVFLFSKTGERFCNISEVSLESALRERILYDYYKSRAVNERTYVNTINFYQVADAVYAMALLSSSSWLSTDFEPSPVYDDIYYQREGKKLPVQMRDVRKRWTGCGNMALGTC